jgi:competence protein ComEA
LLRRADQIVVAVCVALGIGAVGCYWVTQGGLRGRVIELEAAPPRHIQFQVDLNAAPWPELAQLPGIGETLARRIVASRVADGPFLDQRDLMRVQGIGPRTLEGLEPYLLPMPEGEAVAGP